MKPFDVGRRASPQPLSPSVTPPSDPCLPQTWQVSNIDHFEHALEKLRRVLEKIDGTTTTSGNVKNEPAENTKVKKPKTRASKLEHKLVEEVLKESKYQIKDLAAPPEELTDLDEYVFVVRTRTDKNTFEKVIYIDIKSEGLADALRIILHDVHGLSLRDDLITIEQNMLYHYVTELKTHRTQLTGNSEHEVKCKHVTLLLDYLGRTFASTRSSVTSYVNNGEITFDLLWALFKPNATIYTTILDDEKPACFSYKSGMEKETNNGVKYFHVECRYLDFDGQVFGEASTALGILSFQGTKRIERLEAFPIQFHRRQNEMRKHFLRCGRQFVSLIGQHHVQYKGNGFYVDKDGYVQVPVESRIMVDTAFFRKVNPNYTRPQVNELARPGSSDTLCFLFSVPVSDDVKKGPDPETLNDNELMICSQTVYGWSFGNKKWIEFAVDSIKDISWNPSSFESLEIPAAKKKIISGLTEAHMSREANAALDDFVEGKGQGVVALLHGPPGVGKTLTAEGLSEYFERPLYVISAGELGRDSAQLEAQLSQIFRLAHHWKAIVLLDEADVFVQARSFDSHHNATVSVFLRTLEYFRGIMFLTTNRVKEFDDAIRGRISVALYYGPLGFSTRRALWKSFLKKADATALGTQYKPADLERLAERETNGRQIKNIVTTGYAIARSEGKPLSHSHLELVVKLDEEFQNEYNGVGNIGNNMSYA